MTRRSAGIEQLLQFEQQTPTMKMDVLRCQTVPGIQKELTMFLLVYNLVRMTVLEAAQRQDVPPERISFIDALRWLPPSLATSCLSSSSIHFVPVALSHAFASADRKNFR